MRNTSRVAGGCVVLAAIVIAACFGEAKLATSRQAVIVPDRDPVVMGSAMVGTSIMTNPAITLSPQDELSDDTITSITKSCGSDFSIPPGVGVGARVFCSAGPVGSGSALAFGGATYGSGACVPVSFAFNATFTPTGPGSASCGLTVNYDSAGGGSGSTLITLDATGVAPAYALTVSPQPRFSFSDQILMVTSSATSVTLKNTGATAMTVTGTNSNTADFTVSSVSGSTFASQTLAVGQSVDYSVTCTPQALGPRSGTLTFSSLAGPRTLALDCNGIPVSSLEIAPVPAAFASTLVGRAPANLTVSIKNTNTVATTVSLSLNAATPELAFAPGGDPSGAVGPGATVVARFQYTAATEHPAGSLGTLTVNYTGPGNAPRNITINGTALNGEIGWAPAAIDFGPVCVGATASKQVVVYASAAGNVDVSSVTGGAAPFGVTRTTGTLQGNHGNTIDFMATVTPTAPGELMGSFTLNTNLPTSAAKAIPLMAVALPAGVTPTPDLVHFGPGRVGMTTAAKTIELTNCGNAPINITAARIEGASGSDFTIVSPENPVMALPQMGSVKFLVVMSPRKTGTKAAQLVIEYDGGTVTADLDGNGFGGDETDLLDRGTYYACSTGSGSALAPIAVALLLLLRRRRRA